MKKNLLCQREICAVWSFHNCLRITNYGLSLLLELCQRTLASIKGFFCQELKIMAFFVAWTLHTKLLQPMSLSKNRMYYYEKSL